MTNFILISGPFAGSVVAEGRILDIDFQEMDDDLQSRIRGWAEHNYTRGGRVVHWDEVCEEYENSWESEPTEEEVDLLPLSEWGGA
jgi:hypothetical protein